MKTIFKRARFLAPILGAAALMLSTTPASAGPAVVGAGVATGFVNSGLETSLQCVSNAGNPGYVFAGVAIAGAITDGTVAGTSVAPVSVTAPNPAGQATSDPYNGTPLGCDGLVGSTVNSVLSAAPPGTPLLSCPPSAVAGSCHTGPDSSNILADEGTVKGQGLPAFGCAPGSPVACSLSGTFVRYGVNVLVSLKGCLNVGASSCTGYTNDVVVAASVLPTGVVTNLTGGGNANAFAGPFVVTGAGALSATNVAVNQLYCLGAPAAATQIAGLYSAAPTCDGTTGL